MEGYKEKRVVEWVKRHDDLPLTLCWYHRRVHNDHHRHRHRHRIQSQFIGNTLDGDDNVSAIAKIQCEEKKTAYNAGVNKYLHMRRKREKRLWNGNRANSAGERKKYLEIFNYHGYYRAVCLRRRGKKTVQGKNRYVEQTDRPKIYAVICEWFS